MTDCPFNPKQTDWMVAAAVFMMISVRIMTILVMTQTAEISGTTIEQVAVSYEANPVMKAAINLKGSTFALQFVVIPAVSIATYLLFRRRVLAGRMDSDLLSYFVQFIFFLMLLNFLNDATYLIGVTMR